MIYSILYIFISLCLIACANNKDVRNNKGALFKTSREDVMPPPNSNNPYKGSFDIESAKKIPIVDKSIHEKQANVSAASHVHTQDSSVNERNSRSGRLVDRKSPQARHEKMIEGTSPVFSPQGSESNNKYFNSMNLRK